MKTPEEMAKEWAKQEVPQYHHICCTPMDCYAHKKAERGFLAGYKAAMEQVEAYKDEAKGFAKKLRELTPITDL